MVEESKKDKRPNIARPAQSQAYLDILLSLSADAKKAGKSVIMPDSIHEACGSAGMRTNVGGGAAAKSNMSGSALSNKKDKAISFILTAAKNEGMTDSQAEAMVVSINSRICDIADVATTGSASASDWLNQFK